MTAWETIEFMLGLAAYVVVLVIGLGFSLGGGSWGTPVQKSRYDAPGPQDFVP